MKHGKKYTEAAKLVDRSVAYEPAEAISVVKKTASAKFDETVEVHIRTGCDGRHADQQVRGAVVLPNGTGKTVRVLVFAKGAKLDEAQAAGADFFAAGFFAGFASAVANASRNLCSSLKCSIFLRIDVNSLLSASIS